MKADAEVGVSCVFRICHHHPLDERAFHGSGDLGSNFVVVGGKHFLEGFCDLFVGF